MMRKLLFISPELPYPAQSGGKVKTLKLVQSLAGRYDVTFASPLKLDDAQHCAAFEQVSGCTAHLHMPVDVPRNAFTLAESYLRRVPLNVLRTADRALRRQIASIADEYDVIVLDHYEVIAYLPDDYEGLVVYHAHNAYYQIWQRFASLPGNPLMRAAAWLEARRVRRCETAVAERADLVFAAPNDARELEAAGVSPASISDTYHLGDDTQLSLPELRFEDTDEKLMYVGFLGWEPNVQGLLWFIERVWPELLSRRPGLTFDIVGKNPDQRLRDAVADHPGIRLTGFVADLQTVYRDSRVSVAPLLFGSGMKVKVLDAMARGIPTVTTSVGAEGIDVVDGVQLMVEDDPFHMAECVDALLGNQVLWEQMQAESRKLIAARYTWGQLFSSMHAAIDRSLRRHRAARHSVRAGAVSHAG